MFFYGEGSTVLKEISYKSQYIAEQELIDAGQYDEEHYYHLFFQIVEVYEDSIAVLKNFPGLDSISMRQATVFNFYGEIVYQSDGDFNILYSTSACHSGTAPT
ncbi:MAG: hypothetical protein JW822_04835 [Spirochaetales bacterium]|nr:hypothetical protein [Spirochaetales bacterium]